MCVLETHHEKAGGDHNRMKSFETREAVSQNLKDAGCGVDTINNFMEYYDAGNVREQLRLLERHREQLLSKVHKEERHISCLDYLVYQIKDSAATTRASKLQRSKQQGL